jgi:hypothetical protein
MNLNQLNLRIRLTFLSTALLLVVATLPAFAEQYGYTDDGERVVLYDDGRWEKADISLDAPASKPLLVTDLRWRQQEDVVTLYAEVVNVSGDNLNFIDFSVALFDSDGLPIPLESDGLLSRYADKFFDPGEALGLSANVTVPSDVVVSEMRVLAN